MVICESLFSQLEFVIPSDMLSRVFAIWPVPLAQILPILTLSFSHAHLPSHLAPIICLKSFNFIKIKIILLSSNFKQIIGARWEGKCAWLKDRVRIGKIWAKGTGQMAKTRESISEGITNSNWLNRDSQITNYNI